MGTYVMLDIGQPAPDFDLPRDGGGRVSLSSLRGKPVVLYFYPKDDTSGCTKQALTFTENLDAFEAAGATVVGISKDSIAEHDKFRDKHQLKITLLSDENSDACEQYGVWAEKSMYGKTHMGIERSTFLIDAKGEIARVWRKVNVPGHVEDVLDAVRAL